MKNKELRGIPTVPPESDYTKFSRNSSTDGISTDEELIRALRDTMRNSEGSSTVKNTDKDDYFFDEADDEEDSFRSSELETGYTSSELSNPDTKTDELLSEADENAQSAPVSDEPASKDSEEAAGEQASDKPDMVSGEQTSGTPDAASGEQASDEPDTASDEQLSDDKANIKEAAAESALSVNEASVPDSDSPSGTPDIHHGGPKKTDAIKKLFAGKKEKREKSKKAADPRLLKLKKIILGAIAALLAVAIIMYIKTAFDYRSHFLNNTTLNGFDVSGKTVDEVKTMFKDHAEDYELKISFRDNVEENITASDIDYKYVPDDSIEKALDSQNYIFWPSEFFSETEKTIPAPVSYDAETLYNILTSYPEMQPENMIAPTNAYIQYADGSFGVAPETYGNTLNTDNVINAVIEAIDLEQSTINVEDVTDAYVQPDIYVDNAELIASAENLNSICRASITYQLPTGNKVLDGNTFINWLVTDENGNYKKDDAIWDEHVEDFVSSLAEEVGRHTFKATDFGEVDIRTSSFSSDCSWWIDEDAETEQLKEELSSGTITEREPVWGQAPFTLENNGYGYDQVEIDISRQHLWVYQDGEMVFETDIVSGANTASKHTPSGIYKVQWKERNHILRGERQSDGSYEYETPCSYWMPFITDIGIGMHDATWQYAFGGTRYLSGYGSHGCINLSLSSVAEIYSIVDAGTPVIVYYSEGCDFE